MSTSTEQLISHPRLVPPVVTALHALDLIRAHRPRDVVESTLTVSGASFPVVSAGEGRPLVLVHGLGHDLSDWAPLFRRRPDGVRLVALDLPGFGLAAVDAPTVTMALLVEAVAQTIRFAGPGAIVVGSSLGGHLALLAALQHFAAEPARDADNARRLSSDALRGLVLVSPGGLTHVSSTTASMARAYYSEASIRARSDDEIIRNSRRIFANPDGIESHALAAKKLAIHRSPLRSSFARAFSSVVADVFHHPVAERMAHINVPFLVVHGARDVVVDRSPLEAAVAKNAHGRFIGFDDVGHLPMVEDADRFAQVCFSFAAEVAS